MKTLKLGGDVAVPWYLPEQPTIDAPLSREAYEALRVMPFQDFDAATQRRLNAEASALNPPARGGRDVRASLQPAHAACSLSKGAKTPKEWRS